MATVFRFKRERLPLVINYVASKENLAAAKEYKTFFEHESGVPFKIDAREDAELV